MCESAVPLSQEVIPECTFETITDAFQGAVNVVGIGRPVEVGVAQLGELVQADMEKPLPCLKGYSPRSLLSLLDRRFETGYPVGDLTTRVEDPYLQVKANAVDAACAFAPHGATFGGCFEPGLVSST